MTFAERFEQTFKRLLPSPFSIALILTVVAFLVALITTIPEQLSLPRYGLQLTEFWQEGLWNGPLMIFAMQMMLMLVLGHSLALSEPVNKFIQQITKRINSNASAAFWVTILTLLVALFNWGLGLIFGAIFARKVGEHSLKNGIKINYPLIGAAGYTGLMVWHGGLSGSAPLKANDPGHIREIMSGSLSSSQLAKLPDQIPIEETLFSAMNIFTSLALIVIIPSLLYLLGKKVKPKSFSFPIRMREEELGLRIIGAEKIDYSSYIGRSIGFLICAFGVYLATSGNDQGGLSFLTPNYINFILLGLSMLLHKNIRSFLNAIDEAIGGAAGILIQFPLYFGIMGIMTESGLVFEIADWLTRNSSAVSFPVFTFISSGIINIFVPSGGGQWAVQAPILIQTAGDLNVPLSKAIMSLAYGDQLTNMLQPFWALPLLGITGLKAKEILPYTLIAMVVGAVIFITALILF